MYFIRCSVRQCYSGHLCKYIAYSRPLQKWNTTHHSRRSIFNDEQPRRRRRRPLQPNKVQMTPILLTCLLKSFSLTQSPQYATQPVSQPLCQCLPMEAAWDGGGDGANPLEFISPPTRWTIEAGLVFRSAVSCADRHTEGCLLLD